MAEKHKMYQKELEEERNKKKAVAELIERARGDRSLNEFARQAGVSPAALSRIRKMDYMPGPLAIKKLTSEQAMPQGGVTYEEIMEAAGYRSKNDILAEEMTPLSSELKYKNSLKERLENVHDVESDIIRSLYDKGIAFKRVYTRDDPTKKEDLSLILYEETISEWLFDYRHISYDTKVRMIFAMEILGNALRYRYTETMKYSIVTNSDKYFQFFKRYDHLLPIRGEVSVLLFDGEKRAIVEEIYMSNYCEGDRSREVYLV